MRPVESTWCYVELCQCKFPIVVEPMLFNVLITLMNKVELAHIVVFDSHFEFQMTAIFCPFLEVVIPKVHKVKFILIILMLMFVRMYQYN